MKRVGRWTWMLLTLLLLLPMVLTVAFFTDQYQKQQLLRQMRRPILNWMKRLRQC